MPWGRTDKPLDARKDDKLEIGPYAKGLANFIKTTTTPMTIGLQGEWGSGKTSLMQLIKEDVAPTPKDEKDKKRPKEPIRAVWFDAWQYGALGNADMLGLLMLRDLSSLLLRDMQDEDNVGHRFMRRLAVAFKSAAPAVAGTVTNAVTGGIGGDVATNAMQGMLSDSGGESDLRKAFALLVAKSLEKTKQERMVIFIDDLDRIQPDRAVRLLEVLKNFMDVDKCVFVVACDYQVVREGVRTLMKITEKEDEKVDAFFHKIFQVPFHMPSSSYSIHTLLENYLCERLGGSTTALNFLKDGLKDTNRQWMTKLQKVIQLALGTNPRAFKRYMNLLDLMTHVDEAFGDGKLSSWKINNAAEKRSTIQWISSLLPIVALQQRWQKSAPYILNNAATADKRLGKKHPELKNITLLERRMRTLTGEWGQISSAEDSDDDERQEELAATIYPDGRLAGHLRATYDIESDIEVYESRHPEVKALRDFLEAWYDLLNSSDVIGHLTTDELESVRGWSERMMKMGAADSKVSVLELFADECDKQVPGREGIGDDIAGMIERLQGATRHLPAYLKPYPKKESYSQRLKFNGQGQTVLTISSTKVSLKLNIGTNFQQNWLPTLHERGLDLIQAFEAADIEGSWTGTSKSEYFTKSYTVDLKELKGSGKFCVKKLNSLADALIVMLKSLQIDVQEWEQRLNNGESLPSAHTEAPKTSESHQLEHAPEAVEEPITVSLEDAPSA